MEQHGAVGESISRFKGVVETAHRCLEQLMSKLIKSNGVTERLKVSTWMKRVGLMKALKSQAEEMIFDELNHT